MSVLNFKGSLDYVCIGGESPPDYGALGFSGLGIVLLGGLGVFFSFWKTSHMLFEMDCCCSIVNMDGFVY